MQSLAAQSSSSNSPYSSFPHPQEHQQLFNPDPPRQFDPSPLPNHHDQALYQQQQNRSRQSSGPSSAMGGAGGDGSYGGRDEGPVWSAPLDGQQGRPGSDMSGGGRNRSTSRPSTAAASSSNRSPQPPPPQPPFPQSQFAPPRPPSSSHSSASHSSSSHRHHSFSPNTTPQQHQQIPQLFSHPSPSPSPHQTFYSTTPRPPAGLAGQHSYNGPDDGRESGNDQREERPFRQSRNGSTEAALGYDSLLGPAPGSSDYHNSDGTDSRTRGNSPGDRVLGVDRDSRGTSRSNSENGGSGGSGGAFPRPQTTPPTGTDQFSQGPNDYSGGGQHGGANDHSSASTLPSSAGLVSPLSPHVEPFSPSISNSTSGGNWSTAGRSFGTVQGNNSLGKPSSPQELRGHLQSQQQPQFYPPPTHRPSLPLSIQDPTPFSTYSAIQQPHISSADRKFALPAGLGGVPEHGGYPSHAPPLILPQNNHEVPGLPPPQQFYGSGNGNNSLQLGGGGGLYGSDQESGYGSMPGGGGSNGGANPYSSTMSASGSREGYASSGGITGLGLQTRREIAADRGGYVRASYSSETAARGLGVGPVGMTAAAGASSVTTGAVAGEGASLEEISTIFVVGFPEDMLEREFQNMFVFSVGFEAATLKIPASTVAARERDRELATAAALSAAVGASSGLKQVPIVPSGLVGPSGLGLSSQVAFQDPFGGMLDGGAYEDAFGNLPLDGPGSALAQALGRDAAGSPAGTRKQIIGFAKFRTRAQALDARDILSGKKVDAEKGCILKAEMAKKNLHTKRGISNELAGIPGGPSFPLSSLDSATLGRLVNASNLNPAVLAELARQSAAQQAQASQQSTTQDRDARTQSAAFEAFHSIPSYSASTGMREREHSVNSTGGASYARSSVSGGFPTNGREYYDEGTSPTLTSAAYYNLPRPDPPRQGYGQQDRSSPPDYPSELAHSPTSSSSGPQSSPHLRGAILQLAYSGNSMMQQLDEVSSSDPQQQQQQRTLALASLSAQPRPYPSSTQYPSSDSGYASENRERSSIPPVNYNQSQSLYQGFSSSPLGNPASRMGNISGPGLSAIPTSPPMGPSHSNNGIPRTQNPADMNAPKNTLYVGGLPAVLPSLTGPFSAAHLEDSLRNAFSRCPGFRRLCFRSKSNGPIVFVEFDDVMYATQALQDMYGHTLGGLIKGGIRLSYSKNPLGVRSNGSPLPPLADGTFSGSPFGNTSPLMDRRPSQSVFGAGPSLDYRQSSIPRSPPVGAPLQFGGGGTFAPFSYEHSHTT